VASVAVQVAEDEQTAHSSRAYRAPSCSRAEGSAPAENGPASPTSSPPPTPDPLTTITREA
jgi:hypothetical protein